MKNWEKTLDEFRKFGGIAENVILSEGVYGRGLFPKDPKLPIKLLVPNELLVATEWLKLNESNELILSDECDWSLEKKLFYLNYLRDFGYSEETKNEIFKRQSEFYSLPESVKSMLKGFGFSELLFQKPDAQSRLDAFKISRRIVTKNNNLVLMPIIELINHDEKFNKSFTVSRDISVNGKFLSEVLINYGMGGDAVLMFETYGFSTIKPYAFSGALSVNIGSKIIRIARYVNLYDKMDKTNIPKVMVQGNEINLSCLVVGSVNDKTSPKKIFLKLMGDVGMPATLANELFNGIVNMNRQFFNRLLKELEPLEGNTVNNLRTMANNQMVTLC